MKLKSIWEGGPIWLYFHVLGCGRGCIGVCAWDVTKFAQKQFVKRAQKIKRGSLDIWGEVSLHFPPSELLSKQISVPIFLSPPYMCSFCSLLAVGLLYYVIYVGMPPSHPLVVCSRDKGCACGCGCGCSKEAG